MTDLSKKKQKEVMKKYGELVCEACKDKLYKNMIPIQERLDAGKPPHLRHLVRLQKSLCPKCLIAVTKQKSKELT